ncbi:MAG: heparinase II/III family protein [Beijerinckiaceae bacterium]
MAFRRLIADRALAGAVAQQGMREVGAVFGRALQPFARRVPERLLIAPQDIRTSDPTIALDIYAGQLKFAGRLLETHGRSPFDLAAPSEAFGVVLHGFSWLRHLRAAESALAKANGRALVADWLASAKSGRQSVALRSDVTARRLMSWLSQAPLLLEGADASFYRSFIKGIAQDAARVNRAMKSAPPNELRLLLQLALTHYAISSAESDADIKDAATRLCDLLDDQIQPDGSHISRNPGFLVDLLLDLLPLKLAFPWRRIQTPQPIVSAIDRIIPMLRMMRHADGTLALFHGMGATRADLVAAVLAQDDIMAPPATSAPYGGYQRVEAGEAVLLVDSGEAPAPPLAGKSHAAPAAFEFSSHGQRLIVNCGAPPAHKPEFLEVSRLTAAHSTLVMDERTIGHFAKSRFVGKLVGPQYVGGARNVTSQRSVSAEGTLLTIAHDGYSRAFGMRHERKMALSADGQTLEGEDVLHIERKTKAPGVPYLLRFHLHPRIKASLRQDHKGAYLVMHNRQVWEFEAGDFEIAIEESVLLANADGPRRTDQIVVRANTGTDLSIAWSFRQSRKS